MSTYSITTNGADQLVQNDGSGNLPALSAVNLTDIPGASITPGTIELAALSSSGTPSETTYLRGDGTWSNPNALTTLGDLLYGGTDGTPTRLAGNPSTTDAVLVSHGDGSEATAPILSNAPALSGTNFIAATIPGTSLVAASITGTQIASSVALAGSPTTTTQSAGDASTKVATTAYVDGKTPSLTSYSTALSSDVAISTSGSYYDGPSVAQGTVGTWFVTATVTVNSTAGLQFSLKLWDGTTVIASAQVANSVANQPESATVSGIISSPAGNLKISVAANSTGGTIEHNSTGLGKDTMITAIRIQ